MAMAASVLLWAQQVAQLFSGLPASFYVGAAVIALYQVSKFSELTVDDARRRRRFLGISNLEANDFTSATVYYLALSLFIALILFCYLVACRVSPDVVSGLLKVTGSAEGKPASASEAVSYPLYVAALFLGLSQPVVPLFSHFLESTKTFFHDKIYVPDYILDQSQAIASKLKSGCDDDKKKLTNIIKRLISNESIASMSDYADSAFYKEHLDELDLIDRDLSASPQESWNA